MKPKHWKLPLGRIQVKLFSISFHPQQTLSSMGYLALFNTNCEWIDIKTSECETPFISWLSENQDYYVGALQDDLKLDQCK